MTFSDYVNFLHGYCDTDMKTDVFMKLLLDKVMVVPLSSADEQRDYNGDYNPLANLSANTLKSYYNGIRELPQKSAAWILARLDKEQFKEYIDSFEFSDDTSSEICNRLKRMGIRATPETIAETLTNWFVNILTFIADEKKFEITQNHNLPPKNAYFTGRQKRLGDIDDLFKKGKKDAVSICQTVSGLGGIGKTQLAVQYAYSYCRNYINFIWFVVSESSTTVYNYFKDLAEHFSLYLPDNCTPEDLQMVIKTWLSDNQYWLLIFDNLESYDTIKPYLPQKINGRIIITSRNTRIDYGETLELEVFDLDESVNFLKRRLSENDSMKMEKYKFDDFNEQAPVLAKRLGYLPLALEQAAAYIREVRLTIADYVEKLDRNGLDIFDDEKSKAEFYTRAVHTTWAISFKNLELSAQYLMNLCAYMAPDRIPVNFFVEMRDKLPSPLKDDLADDDIKDRIVNGLRIFSLATGDAYFINIHRLVQEVVRKSHEVTADAN